MKTTLAGMELAHPVMVGAGVCKFPRGNPGLEDLARSNASAVLFGSITKEARDGNKGSNLYHDGEYFSLNRFGMPNPGMVAAANAIRELGLEIRTKKPLIVSVADFTPEAFARIVANLSDLDIDAIEVNAGCPNVAVEGALKPPLSYDVDSLKLTLDLLFRVANANCRVGLKLSPFLDLVLLRQVVEILSRYERLGYIASSNTIPSALALDVDGAPYIDDGDGHAGMGGAALKPLALGNIANLRRMLDALGRPDIDLVGVGGVRSGRDVLDYLHAGAKAVQVVTATMGGRGLRIFDDILAEYVDLVGAEDMESEHE